MWRAKGAGSNNKWMYNGSKFRLADFSFKEETEGDNGSRGQLLLQVGITDYKDLQGTNIADYAAELVAPGTGGQRFRKYGTSHCFNV